MISSLVYTPVMLRLLGQSEYGLYQLVNSFVSYLGLLSFGFSGAYMRYYAKYEGENKQSEIKNLNGIFFIIFSLITLLCLGCGLILTKNITLIFGEGLNPEEYKIARILMVLMVLGLSTTMFSTVFTCYATAHEQFVFQRLLELLQNILNPFIALPLLISGYGSIGMVTVSTSLVLIKFLVNVIFCRKHLHIRFSFRNLNFSLIKELSSFTFFIFLNEIIDKVNWSLDKVLLGRFSGTVAVSIYGVASNLNLMYQNLLSAISNVFIPKVNRIVMQKHDDKALSDVFIKVGRIQFIMAYLIISGFIFFGKTFIELWAGNGYEESYYVGLLLMIPATMELIQFIGIEIQKAKNMHQARSIVYACISLMNICMSIVLIKKFGALGAAAGTTFSLLIGTWIFMNIYYYKKIGLDIPRFWKNILSFFPVILLTSITGIILNKYTLSTSWVGLLLNIIIYICIYCVAMYFIGMNGEEKNLINRRKG